MVLLIAFALILGLSDPPFSTVCVADNGERGELAQPQSIGSRCVFLNELGYIRAVGEVGSP